MENFETVMEFATFVISSVSICISLWVMWKIEEDNERRNGGGKL